MIKRNRVILVTIGLLVAAIAVLAFINQGGADRRRTLQEDRQFLLKLDGEVAATAGLQDLMGLQPEEFTTRLAAGGAMPRDTVLQGVELRLIYEHFGIDMSGATVFIVRGLDGYASAVRPAEVMAEDTIYICIRMDGNLLEGKGAGGWGPFLMAVRGSRFAQRWCKYVEEVDARR